MQLEQPLLPQLSFRRKLAAAMVVTFTLMLGVRALTSLVMLGTAFLRTHGLGREVLLTWRIDFYVGQAIFLAALCAYLVWLKRQVDEMWPHVGEPVVPRILSGGPVRALDAVDDFAAGGRTATARDGSGRVRRPFHQQSSDGSRLCLRHRRLRG